MGYHPTSRALPRPPSWPVREVAQHSVLFFAGVVHRIEVTKHGNFDEGQGIHFAISGVASPAWPTTLWHLGNTSPAWRSPNRMRAGACCITCPYDCKLCPFCNSVCLLAFLTT